MKHETDEQSPDETEPDRKNGSGGTTNASRGLQAGSKSRIGPTGELDELAEGLRLRKVRNRLLT